MRHLRYSDSPNARFLVGEMPAPHTLHTSWWEGTGVSVAVHALVLGIAIYGATHARQVVQTATTVTDRFRPVFFDHPVTGPGGGGGGGGDTRSARPRKAELVPDTPREFRATPTPLDLAPKPEIQVPFATAQAMETLPGAVTPIDQLDSVARGPGTGPGGGGGRGSGSGQDGEGPGADAGRLGNFGGGPRQPGNGVTSPKLIHEVKPQYTADAVRAKLQGVIEMEAVVLPNGTVDPASIRVMRSLDSLFGLDRQAMKALQEWRFQPGTFKGQPVAVRINVELTFTLR